MKCKSNNSRNVIIGWFWWFAFWLACFAEIMISHVNCVVHTKQIKEEVEIVAFIRQNEKVREKPRGEWSRVLCFGTTILHLSGIVSSRIGNIRFLVWFLTAMNHSIHWSQNECFFHFDMLSYDVMYFSRWCCPGITLHTFLFLFSINVYEIILILIIL